MDATKAETTPSPPQDDAPALGFPVPVPAPAVVLLLAAGLAGAGVMAMEVLAARAMAPAIGTGSVAWSALLAVALGALAAGNLLGGLLTARASAGAIVSWSLVIAAAAAVALAGGYGIAMRWAGGLDVIPAAVVGAAIGQLLPMLLLGVVSPAIISSAQPGRRPGRWAGAVLAAGSAGGVAGALAVGLCGLPAMGIARCYLAVAIALSLTATPIVLWQRRWLCELAVLAVLVSAGCLWWAEVETGVVQSPLGQIEVRREGEAAVLLIDGLPQSAWPGPLERWDGLRHGYLLEAAVLLADRPRDALVIGLGAGLAPRLLETHGVRCHSVELDSAVVDAARRELGFAGTVDVADGRRYLAGTNAEWDLIVLDVCTSDRLAMHLFTVESMRLIRGRLAPGGVLAVQFIGDDGEFSACLRATAERVFGEVLVLAPQVDMGAVGPRWLFARRRPMPPTEAIAGREAEFPWRVVTSDRPGRVLTDDHFPAETAWARVARAWRRTYAQ